MQFLIQAIVGSVEFLWTCIVILARNWYFALTTYYGLVITLLIAMGAALLTGVFDAVDSFLVLMLDWGLGALPVSTVFEAVAYPSALAYMVNFFLPLDFAVVALTAYLSFLSTLYGLRWIVAFIPTVG